MNKTGLNNFLAAISLACLPGMATAGLVTVDFNFTGNGPDNLPSAVFTGDDGATTVAVEAFSTNPATDSDFPTLTRSSRGLGVCSSFTNGGRIFGPRCRAAEDRQVDGRFSDDSLSLAFEFEVSLMEIRFASVEAPEVVTVPNPLFSLFGGPPSFDILIDEGDQFDLFIDGAAALNDVDASTAFSITATSLLNGIGNTGTSFTVRAEEENDDFFLAGVKVQFEDRNQAPSPVPVPATLTLFGLGLAGLGVLRRNRSTARKGGI
jgi:hypothetical protein